MEVKKSPKADLEGKKSLFLEAGLCVSLLLMIGAFAWGQGKREVRDLSGPVEEFAPTEEIEQTRQDTPVPQMPTPAQVLSVITDNIQIVDNNTKIETNLVFTDFQEEFAFNANPTSAVEIAGDFGDEIFEDVSDPPTFRGGTIDDFARWVRANVQYPQVAQEMNIQGTVRVRFVIEKDGSLSNIEAVSNTDKSLNNEVIRVVKRSPKGAWKAGSQTGTIVRVGVVISVAFNLS